MSSFRVSNRACLLERVERLVTTTPKSNDSHPPGLITLLSLTQNSSVFLKITILRPANNRLCHGSKKDARSRSRTDEYGCVPCSQGSSQGSSQCRPGQADTAVRQRTMLAIYFSYVVYSLTNLFTRLRRRRYSRQCPIDSEAFPVGYR